MLRIFCVNIGSRQVVRIVIYINVLLTVPGYTRVSSNCLFIFRRYCASLLTTIKTKHAVYANIVVIEVISGFSARARARVGDTL